MKQIFLLILFSFSVSVLMTGCTSQMSDKMAVVGDPALTSDPCAAIEQKRIKLDEFTAMVNNTSAFHLEEKAAALSAPGITVSNNKEQMLQDAKKKYAELSAERQKYGCAAPVTSGNQMSDVMTPCAVVDRKLVRLNEFAIMVRDTSSFHLEEKAAALPVPGITVSNNKEQMIRDIKKKYVELSAERQKYGCSTPMNVDITQMFDKTAAVSKPTLLSDQRDTVEKKTIKSDETTTVTNHTTASHVEEKTVTVPVSGIAVNHKKEPILIDTNQKQIESSVERQKYSEEAPRTVTAPKRSDKKEVVSTPTLSSGACTSIVEDLIRLDEFATMVNNTSAFHLQEKAEALSVPGITVSNNKKKMLKDVERKRAKLLAEREKYGCEIAEKK